MYGQSGGWNQSENSFWKYLFDFLISVFFWPLWWASTTIDCALKMVVGLVLSFQEFRGSSDVPSNLL
jgi:hypothetical protein